MQANVYRVKVGDLFLMSCSIECGQATIRLTASTGHAAVSPNEPDAQRTAKALSAFGVPDVTYAGMDR